MVGTSRGGIIAMLMGVARPRTWPAWCSTTSARRSRRAAWRASRATSARTPRPDDWADAARIQQRLHGAVHRAATNADWDVFARLTYRDEDGHPVGDYDPALADTFDGIEFDKPVPALWDEFRALKSTRMLVIRGEHSDLLSPETVREMKSPSTRRSRR